MARPHRAKRQNSCNLSHHQTSLHGTNGDGERQRPRPVVPWTALLARFVADIEMMVGHLDATNFDAAVALARLPTEIKGFGPVKEAAAESALERRDLYLAELHTPTGAGATPPVFARGGPRSTSSSLVRSRRNYPDREPNCSAPCGRRSEAGSLRLSRLSRVDARRFSIWLCRRRIHLLPVVTKRKGKRACTRQANPAASMAAPNPTALTRCSV